MGDNRVVVYGHQQITRKRKLDEALNPVVINSSSVFTFGGNGNNIITMNGNNITVNGRNNVISLNDEYVFTNNGNVIVNDIHFTEVGGNNVTPLNGRFVFTNNGNVIVNGRNNVTPFNGRYVFANNGNIIVNGRNIVRPTPLNGRYVFANNGNVIVNDIHFTEVGGNNVTPLNGRYVSFFANNRNTIQNGRAIAQNIRALAKNCRAVTQNSSCGVCASYTSNANDNINVCTNTSGNSYPVVGVNDACTPTPQKRAKTGTDSTQVVVASNDGKEHPAILDGEECTICYELFTRIAEVAFLPCAHYFHKKCVDNWLEYDNTCPVCRVNAVTGASE